MSISAISAPHTAGTNPTLGAGASLRWWQVASLGAGLVAAFGFYLTTTLHHDVSWYLIATDRMLQGASLYRDIIELNPPLGFYLTMPPVAAARWLGVSADTCFTTYVFALIALSLHLTDRVLAATGDSVARRFPMLCAAAAALVFVPLAAFGEREHLMLILALPYILLAAARPDGCRIPRGLGVLIGVLAALGLGIKPYFLLVPACLEIHIAFVRRSLLSWRRPETLTLGAVLLSYAAAVPIVHPEYVNVIAPDALLVYDAYSAPLRAVLLQPGTIMLLPLALLYVGVRASGRVDRVVDALAITCIALFTVYVIQHKGWFYHLMPATGTALLTTAAIVLRSKGASVGIGTLRLLTPPLALGIALALLIVAVAPGPYRNAFAETLLPDVEKYASGGSIYAFSPQMSVAFPLVSEARVQWSSRFPGQWLLPGVMRRRSAGALDPATATALRDIEHYAIDAVIEDLKAMPPDLVIVDERNPYFGGQSFDFLEYFGHDPRFAQIWRSYVKVKDVSVTIGDVRRDLELWCRADRPHKCDQ